METVVGVVVIVLGLICWVGQLLAVFVPGIAVKLGVSEPEEDVDKAMYLFERFAQGIPDVLLTWMLPASAAMMLGGVTHWPILALIGAGVYLYFPMVFCTTRLALKAHGMQVGSTASQFVAFTLGVLWLISALAMAYLAAVELSDLL